jgi:hypothetical protein
LAGPGAKGGTDLGKGAESVDFLWQVVVEDVAELLLTALRVTEERLVSVCGRKEHGRGDE